MQDAATIDVDEAVQLFSSLDEDEKHRMAFGSLRGSHAVETPAKRASDDAEEAQQRPLTCEEACRKICRVLLDHDDFRDIIHAPQDAGLFIDHLSKSECFIQDKDVCNSLGRIGRRIYDGAKAGTRCTASASSSRVRGAQPTGRRRP
ncbi:MAG: hypothetical protein AAFR47_18530 [Pseudomonadota bacterium]